MKFKIEYDSLLLETVSYIGNELSCLQKHVSAYWRERGPPLGNIIVFLELFIVSEWNSETLRTGVSVQKFKGEHAFQKLRMS